MTRSTSAKAKLLDIERNSYTYKGGGTKKKVAFLRTSHDGLRKVAITTTAMRRTTSESSIDKTLDTESPGTRRSWAQSDAPTFEAMSKFIEKSDSSGSPASSPSLAGYSEDSACSGSEGSPRLSVEGLCIAASASKSRDRQLPALDTFPCKSVSALKPIPSKSKSTVKKEKKRRPPPIKTFKQCDAATSLEMRREYVLYLHDFASLLEQQGISACINYKYYSDEVVASDESAIGSGRHTVSVSMFNVSSEKGCLSIQVAQNFLENSKSQPSSCGKLTHWPKFAQLLACSSAYYLTHDSKMIAPGDTSIKVWPPVRSPEHRGALWNEFMVGGLNFITSGHMPVDPALKFKGEGDFYKAAFGISSIELMLPALWTEAARRRKVDETSALITLAERLCVSPSKFLGIFDVKGSLRAGKHADICVWDTSRKFVVSKHGHVLQSRYSASLYDGSSLKGVVMKTFLRGKCVFDRDDQGGTLGGEPRGKVITMHGGVKE